MIFYLKPAVMTIFIPTIIIIAAIVLLLLLILWLYDFLLGGEDYFTPQKALDQINKIIADNKCEKSIIYDLGSCRGHFVFSLLDKYPEMRAVGIDNSFVRTSIARLRSNFHKGNAKFLKRDIFDINISAADLVYIYLPQELLARLETKLNTELKPGALVITYRVQFSNWRPEKIIALDTAPLTREKIYLYNAPRERPAVLPWGGVHRKN
ncbi:MAG: hypothetical protein A3J48_04420 [Candidatus Doudnabacteria bacterium RIFCSPHIGHO2_02_FULL_46_11]|uniref:Methyltransferase domain-containing protein n=1 Tax=Candidatus Doudnabacteria bacterium RIFCSPHIGHO2_02_FULL_46_11 TaxID=1817832 RepID=A0A1F5P4Z8_9BACT|nr:MAG: hypothetical protein A3J48_04420 [Candidatus Doudnabacteria bacterium RIFCSPHIGHO2_02_FULL_46_11]